MSSGIDSNNEVLREILLHSSGPLRRIPHRLGPSNYVRQGVSSVFLTHALQIALFKASGEKLLKFFILQMMLHVVFFKLAFIISTIGKVRYCEFFWLNKMSQTNKP